jgi:hypothetical protein
MTLPEQAVHSLGPDPSGAQMPRSPNPVQSASPLQR